MTELKVLKLKYKPLDLYGQDYERLFTKIKRMSVQSTKMEGPTEHVAVVEVQWFNRPDTAVLTNLEFIDKLSEITRDGDNYVYVLTGRYFPFYSKLFMDIMDTYDCFLDYPTIFTKEIVSMSIVGSQKSLDGLICHLDELGIAFKTKSIKDYNVQGKEILTVLTPLLTQTQYECLKFAAQNGYYDIPKRCDTKDLAEKKGMAHNAFSMNLRKAERTLFKVMFE